MSYINKRRSSSVWSSQNQLAVSDDVLIPLLAQRSCHLPGNDWNEDWWQFMRNNHIVFGICFCHPLHPLEWWERIMALLGSISIGLIATNIAFLWDASSHIDMEGSIVNVGFGFVVTKGMIFLWTFGAVLHSLYDLIIWNVMACACCHPGGKWGDESYARRFKDCGSYIMIPVVLALMGIAAVAVMRRASDGGDEYGSYNSGGNDNGGDSSTSDNPWADSLVWNGVGGAQSFSFLSKYAIELSLTWFVYFPIVGTILFSGILGCGGRLPVLGGRPRDIRLYQERMEKEGGRVYASI